MDVDVAVARVGGRLTFACVASRKRVAWEYLERARAPCRLVLCVTAIDERLACYLSSTSLIRGGRACGAHLLLATRLNKSRTKVSLADKTLADEPTWRCEPMVRRAIGSKRAGASRGVAWRCAELR